VIKVYRLSHKLALANYPDPFRPKQTNNRWNTNTVQIAYTSEHLALAALELLNYWQNFGSMHGYKIFTYEFEENQLLELKQIAPKLDIHNLKDTRAFGNNWAMQKQSLALKLPSVVLPHSYNYLINPNHSDFEANKVRDLGDFIYDSRITELLARAKK